MTESNCFDLKEDLKSMKIDSAMRRLKIAYRISIVLGIFNLISELASQGVFCNAEEKLTNLLSYGTMIYINSYIEKNKGTSKYVSLIYGEFINLVLVYFAYIKERNYSVLWTQLAPFVAIYYQGYLIESVGGALILSVKHTLVWTVSGYYFSLFSINEVPLIASSSSGICIMMFCCIYLNHLQDLDLCFSKEKLKESHKKLTSVLESLQSYMIVLSSTQQKLFSNSMMQSLIKKEDFFIYLNKLKYFQRYNQVQNKSSLNEDILKTFNQPEGSRVVFGITEKNGLFIEWEGKVEAWDRKNVLILIGRDVTSLLKLKQDSKESHYKTALLRTVTHELRSPTNAMLSMSQFLLESPEITLENKEKVEIISSSCNYLLCLINDLLDYSQIVTGCLKTVRVSFNLIKLMKECLKIFELDLTRSNISTQLLVKSVIPMEIKTDPYRLKQILINLLNNSRKFTKAGKISLVVKIFQGVLRIDCKDTGIGIKEKEIEKLFKVFGKIDDQVNNPQGAGLGLYISNMLVKELGGDQIKVKSTEGLGSKFSFSIPVELGETSALKNHLNSSHPTKNLANNPNLPKKNLNKSQVLIVDDTYFNYLTLLQALEPEGFQCSYALNGEEAIKLVLSENFDCIIMDCEMPVLNGIDTTIILHQMLVDKKIEKLPPIIGATAHEIEFIQKDLLQAGMNDVLVKPCTRDQILEKVSYWIKSYEFM